jgi:hypothetical protein
VLKRALLFIFIAVCGPAGATGSFGLFCCYAPSGITNLNSPLGIHLSGIANYSTQQPFVDLIKNSSWVTSNNGTFDTGEESCLITDSNGWPNTLTSTLNTGGACTGTPTFTYLQLKTSVAQISPYYQGGTYDVYYSGTCTLVYAGDASGTATGTGHDSITITPSSNGAFIQITGMGSGGNYCHNLSLTYSGLTAQWQAGNCNTAASYKCFNPKFLQVESKLSPHSVRFMDWMCTNNTTATENYSNRPVIGTQSYGGVYINGTLQCGVPVEYMVALANYLNADPWFNMPAGATDNYVTNFATYVQANLNSNLRVYWEYSNETWNYVFTQATYIQAQGQALWESGGNQCNSGNTFECNREYHGYRTATMCQDWQTVYGAAFNNQVVCVLGAQAAATETATSSLACPDWSGQPCSSSTYGISAIAIAPYVADCDAGTSGSPAWNPNFLSAGDGGLTDTFTMLTGAGGLMDGYSCNPQISGSDVSFLALTESRIDAYSPTKSGTCASYSYNGHFYECLNYESGQSLTANSWSQYETLFFNAQSDSRMAAVFSDLYAYEVADGFHLMNVFSDIDAWVGTGNFGLLQTVCTTDCTTGTNPTGVKYNAIAAFNLANPCSNPLWCGK